MDLKNYLEGVKGEFYRVGIAGEVFALVTFAGTAILHLLDYGKLARLHDYYAARAEAGADDTETLERTRVRMYRDRARTGNYLRWLFSQND